MHITEQVAVLVLQIGIVLFAVRLFGQLAKKMGIPSVLGELTAGILIGPFALGGIALPFFPDGIFPLPAGFPETYTLAVSIELYAFATVASVVLLYMSGLETDLSMFLRYSIKGGVIGICGVLLTFTAGTLVSAILLNASFFDPFCMFLGVVCTTGSVAISARTLSEKKKMDSPEGVTILSAGIIEDVLWIILLAVVLGVISNIQEQTTDAVSAQAILLLAGKIFGLWLGVTALLLICSKLIASFLKFFKNTLDFSVLALGLALILAGLLEKQGLALIIGAYIAGLSISKTDVAPVIQERIRGLYEFFVPMFFAIMGMMVNIREIIIPEVLIFGALYTLAVILAKVIGAGTPALLLGFNKRGALRIGMGMNPRGEGALITCGMGLAIGVLDNRLFSAAVFMVFLTIVICPPLLALALKIPGRGTRKPVKHNDSVHEEWKFESKEIADLVIDNLLNELRNEGFFIQTMNINEGLSQARKNDIALFITEKNRTISIATSKTDMPFVRNEIYEVILELSHNIEKLKTSMDPVKMKKNLLDTGARTTKDIFALINPECIKMELKSETKEEIITEMVDVLAAADKLKDRNLVLKDVFERERTMCTGMEHGIAIPHAKTDGITETTVAIGIKKEGVNFDSLDGELSRIFILIISPKKACNLYIEFLAAVGAIFGDEALREAIIEAVTPHEAIELIKRHKGKTS
ncbi:MAG: cation:proton antiporter [Treponema sp.]|jgi:Kef-type K+ transport system membrane component KefB/mannitol/fructose-specific phosphotransferase system IIA component (Ntr-type)|nr:cation:proton antiporter [Treponema sp.]